ncbi:MAG TPA: cysteine hydrolase family protein [Usitatibacter sp.]|nr:cysteine hydrolase family protein [Usitatibacter sp.]
MKTALLIVDIQNDYFPGGAMQLVGSPEAGEKAARLLAAFRERGAPVIHMQHVSRRPGAAFFVEGTEGVKIHECVAPLASETVFRKHFPNSFRETPLADHLRAQGAGRLVVAGMMTHMCIDTTARAAADLGFEVQLAHDACATRDLAFGGVTVAAREVQAAFVASLNGLFAKALTVAEILAAPPAA